jgi:pilus assembly protein CpaB
MSPFRLPSIAHPLTRTQRTMLVLGVALATATASSFGIYRTLAKMPADTGSLTSPIVVAATSLPAGTRLDGDAVKIVQWPIDARPASGFTATDAVVGRALIVAVGENEPLTDAKVAAAGAGAGLALLIQPGMRAMSVRVDEVIGVAGFVVPGVRVDVLAIMGRGEDSTSRVVASDVEILTAGERYDRDDVQKDAKPIRSSVVTLLVGSEDAQRIALVQAEGRLMLTLRSPLDHDRQLLPPSAAATLFGTSKEQNPPPAPTAKPARNRAVVEPAPPAPAPYVVDTIRATRRTSESVKEQ